jgi:hypothetical protein
MTASFRKISLGRFFGNRKRSPINKVMLAIALVILILVLFWGEVILP